MPEKPTDLLLLNATNYPRLPIFPYAFVQLHALAKSTALSVVSADVSFSSAAQMRVRIRDLILKHRPRLVGLHVRQADSLLVDDYMEIEAPYAPVRKTADVLAVVREETDAPIALGGFGFTTFGAMMFKNLKADFGILGDPHGLFTHYDDLIAGRAANVPGLIRPGMPSGLMGPHVAAPLDDMEYDEEMAGQIAAFYGPSVIGGAYPPSVAVEIARGCPFSCGFCTEPIVKGRQFRTRNLDAVFADVEFMARRGFWHFWMICSEINTAGPDLALETAERFIRLREKLGVQRLIWRAYHLPRGFTPGMLGVLRRSGFVGGWNDFASVDDSALRRARVPFRRRRLDAYLQNLRIAPLADGFPGERSIGLFAGDLSATPKSIWESLEHLVFEARKLNITRFTLAKATRIFPGEDRPWAPVGRLVDAAMPVFAVAPSVAEHFDNLAFVVRFFNYLERLANIAIGAERPSLSALLKDARIVGHIASLDRSRVECSARDIVGLTSHAPSPRRILAGLLAAGFDRGPIPSLSLAAHLSCVFNDRQSLMKAAVHNLPADQCGAAILRLELFLLARGIDLDQSSQGFFQAACAYKAGHGRS